jgi:hypothetical protein
MRPNGIAIIAMFFLAASVRVATAQQHDPNYPDPPRCFWGGAWTTTLCPAETPPGCYTPKFSPYAGPWPREYESWQWNRTSCVIENNLYTDGSDTPPKRWRRDDKGVVANAPCPNTGAAPGAGTWTSTGVIQNRPTMQSGNCNPVADPQKSSGYVPPARTFEDTRPYCARYPAKCRRPPDTPPGFCVIHPEQCAPDSWNPHPENPASGSSEHE